MDWIDLSQDRGMWRGILKTMINLWILKIAGKFLTV